MTKVRMVTEGSGKDQCAGYICSCHKKYHSPNDDEPALYNPIGTRYWASHGIIHRDSGPAILSKDNSTLIEYWVNGTKITREQFVLRYEMAFLKPYNGI